MGRLDGKVALISGAARGQGEAEARRFVAEGAKVVIADVLDEEGEAVAHELGDDAVFVKLDVTSEEAWQEAVASTVDAFGGLHVLVNNAGVLGAFTPLVDTTVENFMRVLSINLVGTFVGMKTAAPAMRDSGGGSIVNISSTAGMWGVPFAVEYTASKFGVRGITKVAALELGHDGIRVNSVHPAACSPTWSRPWATTARAATTSAFLPVASGTPTTSATSCSSSPPTRAPTARVPSS